MHIHSARRDGIAPSHHPRVFRPPPSAPPPLALYMFTIFVPPSPRIAQPSTSRPSSNRQRSTAVRSSSRRPRSSSSLTTTSPPARTPIRPWPRTLRCAWRRRRRRRKGGEMGGVGCSVARRDRAKFIRTYILVISLLDTLRVCILFSFSDREALLGAEFGHFSGRARESEKGRRRIRTGGRESILMVDRKPQAEVYRTNDADRGRGIIPPIRIG
jgi:hypothetical protein